MQVRKTQFRGGRLRLVATIDQRRAIDRILRHLGLPTDLPPLDCT